MKYSKIQNLLILDDDEIGNLYLGMILSELDFLEDFRIEQSGWDCLDYLRTCQSFPELIMVDLNMPEMDGFDFIEKYEEEFLATHPETIIFVMTNSILEIDRKKSLNFKSVRNFINKPLSEDILRDAFEEIREIKNH
jgi:CheY-like chemotaxis protein